MIKLKSCPFCGGEANEWGVDGGDFVCCESCNIGTEIPQLLEDAIAAWNTRHTPDVDALEAAQKRIAELEARSVGMSDDCDALHFRLICGNIIDAETKAILRRVLVNIQEKSV
jgi:Lar family restriction alleviation protein